MSALRAAPAAASPADLAALEAALGHRFADRTLLERALTHPSRAQEQGAGSDNQRLEFLGDAVLELVVGESLYAAHPDWREGDLTQARAALVNGRTLAQRAKRLGLGGWVRLGRSGEAFDVQPKILTDVFEAVVGALYLDGGIEAARALVRRALPECGDADFAPPPRDPKSRLNEWAHAQRLDPPRYCTIADSGAEGGDGRFAVMVLLEGRAVGEGNGRTKRAAENAAAGSALAQLDPAAASEAAL